MSSLGVFFFWLLSLPVCCHVKLCRSRRRRVKLTPDGGAHWAGRALWGPGALKSFIWRNGRFCDNRIGVSPLAPDPHSRGKRCLHRTRRRTKGDSVLYTRLPLRAITAPGPAVESVRSGRKHPASSSLGSVSAALHASEPQLPAVICGIPCDETAIIQPAFSLYFTFFTYFASRAEKRKTNARNTKFCCVSVALEGRKRWQPRWKQRWLSWFSPWQVSNPFKSWDGTGRDRGAFTLRMRL